MYLGACIFAFNVISLIVSIISGELSEIILSIVFTVIFGIIIFCCHKNCKATPLIKETTTITPVEIQKQQPITQNTNETKIINIGPNGTQVVESKTSNN